MTEAERMSRERVLAVARSWLGTPWHHKARVRGVGVDCAQLLIAVYAEAGLFDAFDPGDYPIDCMLHDSSELALGWCQKFGRPTDNPQPGDAILWRFGRSYSHTGIVVDWPQDGARSVLHAFRPFGQVCETPPDASRLAKQPFLHYTFW